MKKRLLLLFLACTVKSSLHANGSTLAQEIASTSEKSSYNQSIEIILKNPDLSATKKEHFVETILDNQRIELRKTTPLDVAKDVAKDACLYACITSVIYIFFKNTKW